MSSRLRLIANSKPLEVTGSARLRSAPLLQPKARYTLHWQGPHSPQRPLDHLLQAHCIAIAVKRPDRAALLNAFKLEPRGGLIPLLQHLPIDDGHAVCRIAGVSRSRHGQRWQLLPHRRRQIVLRKHRAIGRRGPWLGRCSGGNSRWRGRRWRLCAGCGCRWRRWGLANTRGRWRWSRRSGGLFTRRIRHALGRYGTWLQRDRRGRQKRAGIGRGDRRRWGHHSHRRRGGHGHRGGRGHCSRAGHRRWGRSHRRAHRGRAALHGPPGTARGKARHRNHGAPPQQPVTRARRIRTRCRHGLGMDTGHSTPASLGFCAPQRIKDVGHKNQAPLRKRGSLTPVARLSSMRVRGPARPSGVTPWAS